jgi:hypothetical protein
MLQYQQRFLAHVLLVWCSTILQSALRALFNPHRCLQIPITRNRVTIDTLVNTWIIGLISYNISPLGWDNLRESTWARQLVWDNLLTQHRRQMAWDKDAAVNLLTQHFPSGVSSPTQSPPVLWRLTRSPMLLHGCTGNGLSWQHHNFVLTACCQITNGELDNGLLSARQVGQWRCCDRERSAQIPGYARSLVQRRHRQREQCTLDDTLSLAPSVVLPWLITKVFRNVSQGVQIIM